MRLFELDEATFEGKLFPLGTPIETLVVNVQDGEFQLDIGSGVFLAEKHVFDTEFSVVLVFKVEFETLGHVPLDLMVGWNGGLYLGLHGWQEIATVLVGRELTLLACLQHLNGIESMLSQRWQRKERSVDIVTNVVVATFVKRFGADMGGNISPITQSISVNTLDKQPFLIGTPAQVEQGHGVTVEQTIRMTALVRTARRFSATAKAIDAQVKISAFAAADTHRGRNIAFAGVTMILNARLIACRFTLPMADCHFTTKKMQIPIMILIIILILMLQAVSGMVYIFHLSPQHTSVDLFLQQARIRNLTFHIRFIFKPPLFSGLSIQCSNHTRSLLDNLPGVLRSWPSQEYTHSLLSFHPSSTSPTTVSSKPELFKPEFPALASQSGLEFAAAHNLTGSGIKVGILDTGIDPDHPDLKHAIGHLRDLTSDHDPRARDCTGHGTHVAGILAGLRTGASPRVSLGIYKIFTCSSLTTTTTFSSRSSAWSGSAQVVAKTSDDVILAALQHALADGMHMVSLSLGRGPGWSQDPMAHLLDSMTRLGVLVLVSAGNDQPLLTASSSPPTTGDDQHRAMGVSVPSVAKHVLSIGSVDNSWELGRVVTVRVSRWARTIKYIGHVDPAAMNRAHLATPYDTDACRFEDRPDLKGRIVLVRLEGCSIHIKAANVVRSGAIGLVLYDVTRANQLVSSTMIPVQIAGISQLDAQWLFQHLRPTTPPSSVSTNWTADHSVIPIRSAGQISAFSSRGPSSDLAIKPDVVAPGGRIISTFPSWIFESGYAVMDGTSMSTPYVAACLAVMMQRLRQGIGNDDMGSTHRLAKTLLLNSARVLGAAGGSGSGKGAALERVMNQGAGFVDVKRALKTRLVVVPDRLELGQVRMASDGRLRHFIEAEIRIVNLAGSRRVFKLGHVGAPYQSLSGTKKNQSVKKDNVGIKFESTYVAVPAKSYRRVKMWFQINQFQRGIESGYVRISSSSKNAAADHDGDEVTVPYLLFSDRYDRVPVLLTNSSYPSVDWSFSGDRPLPVLKYRLNFPTPLLIIRLVDARRNNEYVGEVERAVWLPKTRPNTEMSVEWSGRVSRVQPGDPGVSHSLAHQLLRKRDLVGRPSEAVTGDKRGLVAWSRKDVELVNSAWGATKERVLPVGMSQDQTHLRFGFGKSKKWVRASNYGMDTVDVPPGNYRFEVTVLKPLGTVDTYEQWMSEPFLLHT